MAYIGAESPLVVWTAGSLLEDGLTDTCIHLLGDMEDTEDEALPGQDGSQGFIIYNWFGPFLLGAPSRYLRGRC